MDMPETQLSIVELIQNICKDNHISLLPMDRAEDIMTRNPKTLTMDNTIRSGFKFLEDQEFRHIPVVDVPDDREKKPRFIGIASQRDLLRVALFNRGRPGIPQINQDSMRQLLSRVVTRKPKHAAPETPIPEVIAIMLKKHIDMVPVMKDEDLVGVVTTTDIIKLFVRLYNALRILTAKSGKKVKLVLDSVTSEQMMTIFSTVYQSVEEVMTTDIVCLTPQDDLARAIQVMKDGVFRHIPLLDEEGNLTGLVSDRDVLRGIPFGGRGSAISSKEFRDRLFKLSPKDKRNLKVPLKYVMTKKITRITPAKTVFEAARILNKEKLGCLAVVDRKKNLVGILTATDLMNILLKSYEAPQDPDA